MQRGAATKLSKRFSAVFNDTRMLQRMPKNRGLFIELSTAADLIDLGCCKLVVSATLYPKDQLREFLRASEAPPDVPVIGDSLFTEDVSDVLGFVVSEKRAMQPQRHRARPQQIKRILYSQV